MVIFVLSTEFFDKYEMLHCFFKDENRYVKIRTKTFSLSAFAVITIIMFNYLNDMKSC